MCRRGTTSFFNQATELARRQLGLHPTYGLIPVIWLLV